MHWSTRIDVHRSSVSKRRRICFVRMDTIWKTSRWPIGMWRICSQLSSWPSSIPVANPKVTGYRINRCWKVIKLDEKFVPLRRYFSFSLVTRFIVTRSDQSVSFDYVLFIALVRLHKTDPCSSWRSSNFVAFAISLVDESRCEWVHLGPDARHHHVSFNSSDRSGDERRFRLRLFLSRHRTARRDFSLSDGGKSSSTSTEYSQSATELFAQHRRKVIFLDSINRVADTAERHRCSRTSKWFRSAVVVYRK